MWQRRVRFWIEKVVIPLSGVALLFRLSSVSHPDPVLIVIAGALTGLPVALLADRLRVADKAQETKRNGEE